MRRVHVVISLIAIDDRGMLKTPLCPGRRWHLRLRCDTSTASGVAWVIDAHGRVQFANRRRRPRVVVEDRSVTPE